MPPKGVCLKNSRYEASPQENEKRIQYTVSVLLRMATKYVGFLNVLRLDVVEMLRKRSNQRQLSLFLVDDVHNTDDRKDKETKIGNTEN